MIDIELDEEMEMPTPCEFCGSWFDLNDGYASLRPNVNIMICKECHNTEVEEMNG
jgi:hypothetical protein